MTNYMSFADAIHCSAARLEIDDYIGEKIEKISLDVYELIHNFEDDVVSVLECGLYEHLHDITHRPPPLATFYVLSCDEKQIRYRLPTREERRFLDGIKAVPA